MIHLLLRLAVLTIMLLVTLPADAVLAQTEELGGGYRHHGVATAVSNHRGTVATVDGQGRNVVLVWLFDHRGGYALLLLDAATGKSEEFPMPFPPGGDCPYASILSSNNKFYTHFNSHFVEFDPVQRKFTFVHKTTPQMAMGMTEDDSGRIWSVTYPQSGVVSFDPASGQFKDYGHVYKQNWRQYQRYVATDDAGWLYFGIGSTKAQIIVFDPTSGQGRPVFRDSDRPQGTGYVYRDTNGKVYGHVRGEDHWYEFYKGRETKIGKHNAVNPKPIVASSQGLFHRKFPDGKRLVTCDTVTRTLAVKDPKTKETTTFTFDYESLGAHLMGVAAAPDGTICGGTAFPMRFFSYAPKTDEWINRESYGQWNTVVRQGDRFFVGGYGGGFLLEWDPAEPWTKTVKGRAESNPCFLTQCTPAIHRPHELLAHFDGKTIVLAGTPGYGYTGGGLLFWDRSTRAATLVEHTDILPEHSTMSLVALPEGKLLGGTTTSAGTGGERKASEAQLYIIDMETKDIDWHGASVPGAQSYADMCSAPNGMIYGVVDLKRFFVFDPTSRKIVHEDDTFSKFGRTASQQGPRIFVTAPDGKIYMLFRQGVAVVDPDSFAITLLSKSPVPIAAGGDMLDGRIYFSSGSHLYSCSVSD